MKKNKQIKKWNDEYDKLSDKIGDIEWAYFKEAHEKKEDIFPPQKDLNKTLRPHRVRLGELDRKIRMNKEPKFWCKADPENGWILSLVEFKANVDGGGLMDSDGFGRYIKNGQESDIEIYPSDFKYDSIRKDFNTMIWFNK